MEGWLLSVVLVYGILQVLDLWTTHRALLYSGIYETNPLMRGTDTWRFWWKIIYHLPLVYVLYTVTNETRPWIIALLGVLSVYYTWCVMVNIMNIETEKVRRRGY